MNRVRQPRPFVVLGLNFWCKYRGTSLIRCPSENGWVHFLKYRNSTENGRVPSLKFEKHPRKNEWALLLKFKIFGPQKHCLLCTPVHMYPRAPRYFSCFYETTASVAVDTRRQCWDCEKFADKWRPLSSISGVDDGQA